MPEDLTSKLRQLDRPATPDPEFVARLDARLAKDAAFSAGHSPAEVSFADSPAKPRRSWLAAAAAFAVIILVAGTAWIGTSLLLDEGDPNPVLDPSPDDPTRTSLTNTTLGTPDTTRTTVRVASQRPGNGWEAVSPPLSSRLGKVALWTGEEILLWGGEDPRGPGRYFFDGQAYNPSTDVWRPIPPWPFGDDTRDETNFSGVWTGEEMIVWTGRARAAAWNPATNTWRELLDLNLLSGGYQRAVFADGQIIDTRSDMTYDVATGTTRPIEARPPLAERASVILAGDYVVPVTGGAFLDLADDQWVAMPTSPLTPLATAGAWVGPELVAADYQMRSASFDPVTNTWNSLADIPLRFFECFPEMVVVGALPVAGMCSGMAIWQAGSGFWAPIPVPGPGRFLATDDTLFLFSGATLYRYDANLASPPVVLIGFDFEVDLGADWTLKNAGLLGPEGNADGYRHGGFELVVVSPIGRTCRAFSPHPGYSDLGQPDPPTELASAYRDAGTEPGLVVGTDSVLIPAGSVDDQVHVVIFGDDEQGDDARPIVLDVECGGDEVAARDLATRIARHAQLP